jgi:hypothetical protein
VEVGVLGGGSLFMWREYFGKDARIIGIDNNPKAKIWEEYGFEIYIGDQSDPNFWDNFKKKIGPADILLDDGGHTDIQQATTLYCFADNIKDNGVLVIEDTHTSYMQDFKNPSKYSFINLTYNIVDSLNYRSGTLKGNNPILKLPISEIRYFESIVVFEINKNNTSISRMIENDGKDLNIKDYPHKKNRENIDSFYRKFSFIKKVPILGKIIEFFMIKIIRIILYEYVQKKEGNKIKKYFNNK